MDKIKIDELNTETSLSADHLIITQNGKDQETKNTSLHYLKLWLQSISFEDLTKILTEGDNIKINSDAGTKTISISSSALPTKWYVKTAPATAEKGDFLLLENGDVSEYDGEYWQPTSLNLRGTAGISPEVTITEMDNGFHLAIKDAEGEQSTEIFAPYINADGYWVVQDQVTDIKAQGKDGISPTAEIEQNNNEITIIINRGTELESSATLKAPTFVSATAESIDSGEPPKVTIQTNENNESNISFSIPRGAAGELGFRSKQFTLTKAGWLTTNNPITQTVDISTHPLDSSERHVIDIPFKEIKTWANFGVVPYSCTSTEITFQTDINLKGDLHFYITSMGVISNTEEGVENG